MNKAELIKSVAEKTGLPQNVVAKTVQGTLEIIGNTLSDKAKAKSVTIMGFGTFEVQQRKPRIGRNPKTGEEIKIPAKRIIKFRPSKSLKELIE